MEHVAAILLLLGCSDDARTCTELPTPHVGYESEQACEENVEFALRQAGNSHPMVLAKCFAVDPLAEGDMEIVWDVNASGELIASVEPYEGIQDDGLVVAGLEEPASDPVQ